jgi:fatty-acyl-CoA synthase
MYIGDYLGRRAIYTPDKLALVDAGKNPAWRFTFREMNARANRLANWLREVAGVNKGDRVAILARDGVEHLDCFFACAKLGAIHEPFNWRLHWREIAGLLEMTTPKVLIYSDDFKTSVAEIRNLESGIRKYLHIDGEGISGSEHFETILQAAPDTRVTCESLVAEDIACLLFTGGTTGLPKAAMISHRMICWNVLNTVIHDIRHDDIYLDVFPLFHAGGLFTYLTSQIVFGNTTILVRQFDAAQVLDLVERERVTVFAGVPTMYALLTQAPNWASADLSSLRFCTSGGAPLPVPLVEQYAREKKIRFKQGFGMTEYGVGLFALPPEDAIRKAGSIGRPNFFIDARVVDENNQSLGANEIGELVIKGPSRFSGYWNNPEASAAVIDADDWFHTGDLVRYDDEWYFFVVDRKKDMFISGGENIYPTEIENVLYKHPAVQLCAVFGVPDEKWGEVGIARVVLKKKESGELRELREIREIENELMELCRAHLAKFKIPKEIRVVDSLPLSAAGKILKRELKAGD